MIVFCEDCGKKNQLNSIDFKIGRPSFRCTSCGYLNPYYFKPKENLILENADRIFKDISSFPEILGSFLFHSQAGVLKNHMSEILKKIDLDLLGKNMAEMFLAGRSTLDDVNEMVLALADKNMIVKMMGETLFIIIACKTETLRHELAEKLSRPIDEDWS